MSGLLERLADAVVRGRRAILAVAALLLVGGVFGMMNADINYDLFSYLPDDLGSVRGFEILNDEFQLANTAQVLIEDTSPTEASGFADELRSIEGVERVAWVDDFQDIRVPEEFWDEGVRENYFSGGATLMRVSFAEAMNDPRTRRAYERMREVLPRERASITGTQQLDLEDVISEDQVKFAAAALGLVALVLVLTIPSVVVPLLFVVTIGLCVAYNLGLSYYLGQEMSYLTGVIVFALQFAVTMDYALFLYHRFEEEKRGGHVEDAMRRAIVGTFKSVTAASLTTIAGFLALVAMRLGFGADMGLTLARGVAITVVGVLTILPALLIEADPLVRRLSHRTFVPDFGKAGAFTAKHALTFSVIGAVLFVPALIGYSQLELSYDLDESLPEELPSLEAQDRIGEVFGSADTAFLVLEDTGSTRALDEVSDRVADIEGVAGVFSYTQLVDPLIPSEFVPREAKDNFYEDGYTYMAVDIGAGLDEAETDRLVEGLREAGDSYPGTAYVTGAQLLIRDMEAVTAGDVDRVNVISVIAIFAIIALAFRSLAVPVVLLAGIELAIYANQAISGFLGGEVIFIAALAIGAIQLGATVDYAILLTSRFEEEMAKQGRRLPAMRTALGESAQSILVSAGTMFAATIGMVFLSRIETITDLVALISRGAVISFVVVVFLLPAVLVAAQPVFEKAGLGWPRRMEKR